MNAPTPTRTLIALRLAIGLSAWLLPRLAGRLFGLDVPGNPQAPYLARLFGARDVALAAGVLATEGEARRLWIRIGAACDAADAAAGIAAGTSGYLPALSSALVTGTAVGAAALGVSALRAEEEAPPIAGPAA